MKIRDIMTTDVCFVKPEDKVIEAAKLMSREDIGSVPVCDASKVVGILTDRDIILRNVAQGKDPQITQVKEIMTSKVQTVSPDSDVEDVTDVMAENQIRRVPVVENDRLVGMVSISDVVLEEEFDFEASEALTEISQPGTGKQ